MASLLLALVGWGAAVLAVAISEEQAQQAQHAALNSTASTLATYCERVIEGADHAARAIQAALRRGEPMATLQRDLTWLAQDPAYNLAGVIDSQGRFPAQAPPEQQVNLSDREHFLAHRRAPEGSDLLFISPPVVGRVTHKAAFQVTRAARDADGHFQGVIVVSMSVDHIGQQLHLAVLGSQGLAALVGDDGVIRASTAGAASRFAIGQKISREQLALSDQALSQAQAQLPGEPARRYTWRPVPGLPMAVVVGMGRDDAMAANSISRVTLGAFAVLLSLAALAAFAAQRRGQLRHKALLDRLRASEQRLTIAANFRERFLTSISHELRTPLNGILVASELLAAGANDPDSEELSGTLLQASRQLDSMIGSLLDIASIESGRSALHLGKTSVASLAAQIRNAYSQQAESKGLRLQVWIGESAVDEVVVDRIKVMQLTHCLADNALRFTDKGSVMIKLDVPTSQELTIQVADSGAGMPQDQVDRLCAQHAPESADMGAMLGGIGLGLSLVRGLVRLMRGQLEIQSVVGQGTVARVRIPLGEGA